MDFLDKIKNTFKKVKEVIKPVVATSSISGYWNGNCPVCGKHIGIDIYKNKITGEESSTCPRCSSKIVKSDMK